MSDINEASKLYTHAAECHEATAKLHRDAASCYDHNEMTDAKDCSKHAMDSCNTAQKDSVAACDSSDK
jgi:hypothetical protein